MPTSFDLMVSPTGARLMPADHPALPVTGAQIAQTAADCANAGATAIHLHVRDAAGRHSLDPDRYRAVVAQVGRASPLRIQISTEAAGQYDVAAQRACVENATAPEVSIALREIARAPEQVSAVYRAAHLRGIRVQHILYDASDVHALLSAYDRNEIPAESRRVLFVLGRYATGQQSRPADLAPFLRAAAHAHLSWAACAFGRNEQACLLAALGEGGDVRVGFENNMYAPNGVAFPDNATAVAAFCAAADKAGFQPQKVAA